MTSRILHPKRQGVAASVISTAQQTASLPQENEEEDLAAKEEKPFEHPKKVCQSIEPVPQSLKQSKPF